MRVDRVTTATTLNEDESDDQDGDDRQRDAEYNHKKQLFCAGRRRRNVLWKRHNDTGSTSNSSSCSLLSRCRNCELGLALAAGEGRMARAGVVVVIVDEAGASVVASDRSALACRSARLAAMARIARRAQALARRRRQTRGAVHARVRVLLARRHHAHLTQRTPIVHRRVAVVCVCGTAAHGLARLLVEHALSAIATLEVASSCRQWRRGQASNHLELKGELLVEARVDLVEVHPVVGSGGGGGSGDGRSEWQMPFADRLDVAARRVVEDANDEH